MRRARAPLALAIAAFLPLAALAALPGLAPGEPAPPPGVPAQAPWMSSHAAPFTTLVCPQVNALERCNVRATPTAGPANEVDLAMDPADPDHLVVVAKAYNYTRHVGQALLNGVITAYGTSFDGGLTWNDGFLQGYNPLPLVGPALGQTPVKESDPVVDFAADGSLYASTLRFGGAGPGLPVYKSGDGGLTWAEAGKAYAGGTDKQWHVTDPLTGHIYLGTLHQGGIGFVKSTDHGATWSAPVKICSCNYAGIDVGPAGEIHVSGQNSQGTWVLTSADGGATWSAPVKVAPWDIGEFVPCSGRAFRTPNIPVLAASRVAAHPNVLVVGAGQPNGTLNGPGGCPQTPNHDILLARSADGGATWSAPQKVNADPSDLLSLQFMPTVAVGPNGLDVHVAWMDQRHDPSGLTVEVYYRHSPDGGATWGPEVKVTDQPFLALLAHHQSFQQGAFVGDYIGLQASADRAVVAWPDTRYGRSDVFVATIV